MTDIYEYDDKLYIASNGDGIYITKPTFYDHTTGETKLLYPNEARLKNLTYATSIYCSLYIKFVINTSLFNGQVIIL